MPKTFLGGIKIKRLLAPCLTDDLEQPRRIVLTMASDRPLAVQEGESVKRGSLVAPTHEGQAAIFSGLCGTVVAVREEDGLRSVEIERAIPEVTAEEAPAPEETVSPEATEEEAPVSEPSEAAEASGETPEERPASETAEEEEAPASALAEEASASEVAEVASEETAEANEESEAASEETVEANEESEAVSEETAEANEESEAVSEETAEANEETTEKTDEATEEDADPEAAEPFPIPDKPLSQLTPEELRTLLLDRGVTPPPTPERAMKCLIVDCSGDDPYNESRASLTYVYPGDVVGGAKILMKLLGVRCCLFAVSRAHLDMANELESYTTSFSSMLRVAQVKSKYPQAEPHLLVSALFNVEINSRVPMEKTGYAVVTPLLCKTVFDALGRGIPFTHTVVTVAEEALRSKTTFALWVPLGTELGEMVSLLNLRKVKWDRMTVGGGYRALPAEADHRVTQDLEAVTLMASYPGSREEGKGTSTCIGCGRCEKACPLHLLPGRLYDAVLRDDARLADWLAFDECNGCLACSVVCPAELPLGEAIVAYQSLPTGDPSDEE